MAVTRVLVLGVLLKQPMHGYEVRRELESWNAEQWANIAYGSIYFSLTKMAEEGLVEVFSTDDRGNRPARTVYAITDEPPVEVLTSRECDVWLDNEPSIQELLKRELGLGSAFQTTKGYYLDPCRPICRWCRLDGNSGCAR